VISQTNKINEGNKCNLAESKTDLVGMLQKKQRDFGRYEVMKYFMQDDVKRISWSAPIFNGESGLKGRSNYGRRNIRVVVEVFVM